MVEVFGGLFTAAEIKLGLKLGEQHSDPVFDFMIRLADVDGDGQVLVFDDEHVLGMFVPSNFQVRAADCDGLLVLCCSVAAVVIVVEIAESFR